MENIVYLIAAALIPYLVNGINPAIVMSKMIYHKDIRTLGSKNPGFTNFKRVFGNRCAWFVFFFDILKALIPILAFRYIFETDTTLGGQFGAAYSGLFSMLGHVFPVWYKFKGGKGFLVGAAAIGCIDWKTGLVALAIMLVLLAITRYMSLSVIISSLSCPLSLLYFCSPSLTVEILCILCVALLIIRHKDNIKRLFKGTESKFSLGKSSDSKVENNN